MKEEKVVSWWHSYVCHEKHQDETKEKLRRKLIFYNWLFILLLFRKNNFSNEWKWQTQTKTLGNETKKWVHSCDTFLINSIHFLFILPSCYYDQQKHLLLVWIETVKIIAKGGWEEIVKVIIKIKNNKKTQRLSYTSRELTQQWQTTLPNTNRNR